MSDIEYLEKLLLDINILDELKQYTEHTNIFDILKISNAELKHSIMLAYLFNPNENHGLGTKSIELLFKMLAQNKGIDNLNVFELLDIDYEDFNVIREYKNIDILFKSSKSKIIICLENKIWTSEHDNQLERYKNIIDTEYENYKKIFLYLTPYGDLPSDNRWHSISYNDIVEVLDKINIDNLDLRIKVLIQDYKNMIRSKIMEDNELKELCNKIYRKHKRAIDLIIENKEDEIYYFYSLINEYLLKLKDNNLIIYNEKDSSSKTLRFSTTSLEKVFPLIEDVKNSFWGNGRTCTYAIEIKENKLIFELYFSNYFVNKESQYNKIINYLNKLSLKPTKDAWKNGYHLCVKFGNIEIDNENIYNNEKDVIFSKLDKIILPIIQKEKDTYDRD